jgi:hypothetical protein
MLCGACWYCPMYCGKLPKGWLGIGSLAGCINWDCDVCMGAGPEQQDFWGCAGFGGSLALLPQQPEACGWVGLGWQQFDVVCDSDVVGRAVGKVDSARTRSTS